MKIGILGAGQLGRMLATAAIPQAHVVRLYDPDPNPCAALVAPVVRGAFTDLDALARFAEPLDVVTCEFENVPVAALEAVEKIVPVFPKPRSFAIAQDRIAEKDFLKSMGLETAPYAPVDGLDDLRKALRDIGYPAILKTRRLGYDGRGQHTLRTEADIEPAFAALAKATPAKLILEGFVNFDRELSVLCVRARDGEMQCYEAIENEHVEGILDVSRVPARISSDVSAAVTAVSAKILPALDHVGVLCVELFQKDERLIANELAPRVHNSGHWTIEGAFTSQFDNHLRAICGLPLGDARTRSPTAMMNLVGHLPTLDRALSYRPMTAHFYGKEVRPKRKVGHLTLVAQTVSELDAHIVRARQISRP